LLLVATLVSTTIVGAGMAQSFAQNQPVDYWKTLTGYLSLWHDPAYLVLGLPFSLTLITILLAHEFGHFIAARYYGVDASLPFFIPFPTLIGTMGAVIRIRSPILSKRALFDIGIAGPLAGFVALVSPLVAGVMLSKVLPGISERGDLAFGTPLLLQLMEWIRFPGVPLDNIYLHPVARAAWAGLLATALNLLPIGQLDGGHIVYAFLGERTRYLSRFFILVLVLMGAFIAWSWLLWAAILLFALRHPAIVDPNPLGRFRTWLALAALAIFILSFTAAPVHEVMHPAP
jgi:membrane-associated protease RseP (regulator of RpoE activity)